MKKALIALSLSIAIFMLLIASSLPVIKSHDGCQCGLRRSWYSGMNGIFRGKQFSLKIEHPGNPEHKHKIWDATYETVFSLGY